MVLSKTMKIYQHYQNCRLHMRRMKIFTLIFILLIIIKIIGSDGRNEVNFSIQNEDCEDSVKLNMFETNTKKFTFVVCFSIITTS